MYSLNDIKTKEDFVKYYIECYKAGNPPPTATNGSPLKKKAEEFSISPTSIRIEALKRLITEEIKQNPNVTSRELKSKYGPYESYVSSAELKREIKAGQKSIENLL